MKSIIRDKEEHYIIIKGPIQQEGITLKTNTRTSINRPKISFKQKATHSAHTVFPADVCADTKTD